jgi:hypothetical protein
MLTDTANFRNPNYHTPGDSLATLDFVFMKNVVKAILATAADLAVPISVGSDQADLSTWLSADDYYSQFDVEIFIFPNPSNGLLSLRIENAKNGFITRVEVYDIIGKRVYLGALDLPAGTSNSEINLENLANGSYILTMKSENTTKSLGFIISD